MHVWSDIATALERHGKCALVTQLQIEGSGPREAGARMIVMPDGSFTGTIGGGAREWRALALAQTALRRSDCVADISKHALGPELGQCCGGVSRLLIETFDAGRSDEVAELALAEAAGPLVTEATIAEDRVIRNIVDASAVPARQFAWDGGRRLTEAFSSERRKVCIFGAGHVGKALILALAPLPFDVLWIDTRRDAFPTAVPGNVTKVCPGDPVAQLAGVPDGSFIVVLTHSHALDQAIVHSALEAGRFDYVGVIGSATKRARFVSRMRKAGLSAERIDELVCPIGTPGIRSKHPAAIAAATVTELLVRDELVKNSRKPVQFSAEEVKIGARR